LIEPDRKSRVEEILNRSGICTADAFPCRVLEPVLIDDGGKSVGAMAICSYLEGKYPQPPLMPQDPASRSAALYIEEYFYAILAELVSTISRHEAGEMGSQPEIAANLVRNRLRPVMKFLESRKAKSRYLVSDEICIADISIGIALMRLSKHAWIHTSGPYVDRSIFTQMAPDFPLMAEYCNELWERISFKSAREIERIMADSVEVRADGTLSKQDNVTDILRLIAASAPKC
jgi:glutathione S-transferase